MVPKIVTLRLIVITPEEACKLCVHLCICICVYPHDDEHWLWSNLRRRPPLLHAHSWVQVVQPRWGLVGDEIIHGRVRKPRRSSTASIDTVYLWIQVQTKPLRRWSSTFVNHPRRHNLQEAQELEKYFKNTCLFHHQIPSSHCLWALSFEHVCFKRSHVSVCRITSFQLNCKTPPTNTLTSSNSSLSMSVFKLDLMSKFWIYLFTLVCPNPANSAKQPIQHSN